MIMGSDCIIANFSCFDYPKTQKPPHLLRRFYFFTVEDSPFKNTPQMANNLLIPLYIDRGQENSGGILGK